MAAEDGVVAAQDAEVVLGGVEDGDVACEGLAAVEQGVDVMSGEGGVELGCWAEEGGVGVESEGEEDGGDGGGDV